MGSIRLSERELLLFGSNNTGEFVVTIVIRHRSDLDRPVSTSSNCSFKALPSRLRPFVLQFSIIFAILLLSILVQYRTQFDLYLLSFWSTGSTFSSSQNFFPPFVAKKGANGSSFEKFNLFYPFF